VNQGGTNKFGILVPTAFVEHAFREKHILGVTYLRGSFEVYSRKFGICTALVLVLNDLAVARVHDDEAINKRLLVLVDAVVNLVKLKTYKSLLVTVNEDA
jgi:hypothetical protein